MSARQAVIAAFVTRVAAIAVANGYQTNAGLTLLVGETPELGPDDPTAAIALMVRDDVPTDQSGFDGSGGLTVTVLPIDVQALARADQTQPWLTIEAVIADIRRAIESGDRGLDGLLTTALVRGRTRALPRETGATTIGAGVEYRATFAEGWAE
jgi:hypothetical protein